MWTPPVVIRELVKQTKANLVLLSTTGSKITVTFNDIPLAEALRHIAALTGLTILKVNNTFASSAKTLKAAYGKEYNEAFPRSVQPEPPKPEPLKAPAIETELYRPNYVSAASMATALKSCSAPRVWSSFPARIPRFPSFRTCLPEPREVRAAPEVLAGLAVRTAPAVRTAARRRTAGRPVRLARLWCSGGHER